MTGPVVDFDPSRLAEPRIRPPRATGGWTPGEEHRTPDAVLGAVVAVPGVAVPGVTVPEVAGRFTLTVPDAQQPRTGLALTAWVRWGEPIPGATDDPPGEPLDAPADATAPVVALHLTRQEARRTRIDVVLGAERFFATIGLDAAAAPVPAAGAALDAGEWHHLAVLWDGPSRTARLLVDGEQVAEHPTTVDHLPFRRAAGVAVGKEKRGRRRLLVGPVRLHSRVRTPAEMLAERLTDLAAHPTADESAPLAFRLSDAADEPTLSITDDDAPGRALHVVLENRSPFPVTLPRAQAPREERLELRFRPGALAGEAHHWVDPGSPRWQVEPVERADGGVSLFLAPAEPLELAPGRTVAITLDHVRAAGDAGSHGTHVELHYPHPHHPPRWSTRVSVARVVGRRGRRRSPLRFGVAGDPTVLNDGITKNTLRFYVANSSAARPVTLQAPVDGVGTTLVLSFDAGEPGDPWALATTDQLLAAQVSVDPPDWRIEVDAQDESPQWFLTPTRDQVLGPSKRIEIVVGELLSDAGPAGRTRVSLRLENVEGYWDDDRTVDVEKSLVLRDRDEAALHVHGDIRAAGLQVQGDIRAADLYVQGDIRAEGGAVHDRFGELLPPGVIMLWHGSIADIPDGWVLCDGDNDTPPILGSFIRAGNPLPDPPGGPPTRRTGGAVSVQMKIENLPAHAHSISLREHLFVDGAHPLRQARSSLSDVPKEVEELLNTAPGYAPGGATGTPVIATSGETGSAEPVAIDILPSYHELCYIMKRFPAKPAPQVDR